MVWIVFLCVGVLIFFNISVCRRKMFIVDEVYRDEDDDTSYFCVFVYEGKKREGHFFYEGQLPSVFVVKIIGMDCFLNEYEVELIQ